MLFSDFLRPVILQIIYIGIYGKTGLVSLYRLGNELGHMFGLIHCHHANCIMRSSSYVEDIDQKNRDFCNSCKTLLQDKLE